MNINWLSKITDSLSVNCKSLNHHVKPNVSINSQKEK